MLIYSRDCSHIEVAYFQNAFLVKSACQNNSSLSYLFVIHPSAVVFVAYFVLARKL